MVGNVDEPRRNATGACSRINCDRSTVVSQILALTAGDPTAGLTVAPLTVTAATMTTAPAAPTNPRITHPAPSRPIPAPHPTTNNEATTPGVRHSRLGQTGQCGHYQQGVSHDDRLEAAEPAADRGGITDRTPAVTAAAEAASSAGTIVESSSTSRPPITVA
jgi:hypothetical protein